MINNQVEMSITEKNRNGTNNSNRSFADNTATTITPKKRAHKKIHKKIALFDIQVSLSGICMNRSM